MSDEVGCREAHALASAEINGRLECESGGSPNECLAIGVEGQRRHDEHAVEEAGLDEVVVVEINLFANLLGRQRSTAPHNSAESAVDAAPRAQQTPSGTAVLSRDVLKAVTAARRADAKQLLARQSKLPQLPHNTPEGRADELTLILRTHEAYLHALVHATLGGELPSRRLAQEIEDVMISGESRRTSRDARSDSWPMTRARACLSVSGPPFT